MYVALQIYASPARGLFAGEGEGVVRQGKSWLFWGVHCEPALHC